ncbi:MAG TPA: VanW family protein [Actinophytocola sp.]|uniref:VanW family protein n=1 Tax=Actinophytocola sp. TaxID=1872138 RepID=UPI002DDD8814|nr:VanW family protein [Actinophytocola sp.]HEV2783323.1 VanW family protein [Actinophytocola sp.]
MGQHLWPETHAEQTDLLPPILVVPPDEAPTVRAPHPDHQRKALRRAGIVAGAVFGVLAVLYVVDLLVTSGDVPRGVTVAGVDVGGLSDAEAEQKLRREIEPRLSQVQVRVGDADEVIDPAQAGLRLDWKATLERAGDQPLNPITRIASFFGSREVGVATSTDNSALTAAVEALRVKTNREPVEGGIRFDGVDPVAVEPQPGRMLDAEPARKKIIDDWARGGTIELPVTSTPVKTTSEGVHAALDQIAKPAVSGPVVVHGEGKDATLEPPAIAAALLFEPDGNGGLTAKVDPAKLVEAVQPQLASTEKEGKDAAIVFEGGRPTVQPSQDGKAIDWDKSFAGLLDILKQPTGREVKALYTTKPANVTTEQAEKLGINEVIGEFTTGGFAADSGQNIRTVAREVNGAIVKPGETFSLNGFTGPRTAAQGYIEAGVIKDGAPGREVGGGISQFATTLYNAAYFAGMKDAGHKEHSYYISRYPAAREATVFQNANGGSVIDLKFTNDAPTGVAIQTIWTPSNITVKIWGTKRYIVESITGARTNFVEPQEKPGPAEKCIPTNGIQGFTTSDTRVIKDLSGREIRRDTRTVRYNAQPKIVCPPPA